MFTVSPFKIEEAGTKKIEAAPISGPRQAVEADLFRISHTDGWCLDLAIPKFPDGSKDIRCIDYSDGTPLPLHRLTHGLRMSIMDTGASEDFVELSQAKIKQLEPPYHSNLFKANESELDSGAGCKVRKCIEDLGGRLGSREELLDDCSRRRGYFCAVMNHENVVPALAAYLLTRVFPLYNAYQRLAEELST